MRILSALRPRSPRSDVAGVVAPALVLVGIGLVFSYSAGAWAAQAGVADDPAYYLKRQIVSVLVGLVALVVAARVPLDRLRRQKTWDRAGEKPGSREQNDWVSYVVGHGIACASGSVKLTN